MTELTCIVCPIGCRLTAQTETAGELIVSGNRCPRGVVYAEEEIRAPKRMVTATCALHPATITGTATAAAGAAAGAGSPAFSRTHRHGLCDPRRLPVKSSASCPREKIPALLASIYALEAVPPVKAGTVLLADWQGTGIDIVATATME